MIFDEEFSIRSARASQPYCPSYGTVQKSIELLESSGDIAPSGCCLVHYQAREENKEKAKDELWNGSKLGRVKELIDKKAFGSLDEKSEQFIQASVDWRDRQSEEKEEQERLLLETKQKLAEESKDKRRAEKKARLEEKRRVKQLRTGLIAMLLVAVSAGTIVTNLWQKLEKRIAISELNEKVTQLKTKPSLFGAIEATGQSLDKLNFVHGSLQSILRDVVETSREPNPYRLNKSG